MMSEVDLSEVNPEAIAQWLEGHDDYKVLRRMKMRDDFQGQVDRPVRVIIVDTETTGLDFNQAELIEVGLIAVEVDQDTGAVGKVLATYGGLEDPGVPIPPDSTAIHGITDEMVKGQCFDEVAVRSVCQGAQLFIAHNAAFDKPFMLRRFPELETSVWACSFKELPLKQEGYLSGKLENLVRQLGYFHQAHRAVEDCNALLHFLVEPLAKSQRLPFEVLMASASEPLYEIAALNAPFERKEVLKARGFRWNAEDRVWEATCVGFAQGKELIEWLRSQVYCTADKIRLGFRTRAGQDRYSHKSVRQQFKEV